MSPRVSVQTGKPNRAETFFSSYETLKKLKRQENNRKEEKITDARYCSRTKSDFKPYGLSPLIFVLSKLFGGFISGLKKMETPPLGGVSEISGLKEKISEISGLKEKAET